MFELVQIFLAHGVERLERGQVDLGPALLCIRRRGVSFLVAQSHRGIQDRFLGKGVTSQQCSQPLLRATSAIGIGDILHRGKRLFNLLVMVEHAA